MHTMADVAVLSSSATRHSCKVCRKGFPCGRSLGGHMRSHSLAEVETALDDDGDDDGGDEHQQRRGGFDCATAPGAGGYGLRENPKKTRRLSSSSLNDCDGGGVDERSSHGGGRGELLLSPCASSEVDHERRRERGGGMERELEDAVLIPTEPASGLMPPPRRRRRSMRVPAPAPPPPAPAFDKEPEDVALCLIMLSRDIIDRRRCSTATGGTEYSPEDEDSTRRDHQYHQHDDDSNDDASIGGTKINKRKASRSLVGDEKRGRYECPGCGRAFQSYQALGGHRASHKRINSNCSIAKAVVDHQPEPSVETNTSSFSTASPDANYAADMATAAVVALKAKPHRPIKFECPICFRVFGSGQALGGHKRSHSIAGELYERAHAFEDDGMGDDEQPLSSDGFLDLNLPAPGVED